MSLLNILNIQQFNNGQKTNDFYSNTFEKHIKTHHKNISHPHKHDFYVVIIFTRGSGIHEIDFHSYDIKPGTVFLLKPGQIHNWELSRDVKGFIFFHSKSFIDLNYTNNSVDNFPFFYSSQNPPNVCLKSTQLPAFLNYFKEINQEQKQDYIFKYQRIISLINLLYIELTRVYLTGSIPSVQPHIDSERIKTLELLIEKHYKKTKFASDYAEMMHLSPKHLNRIIKKALNKTTSDLVMERVILEAKRMLIYAKGSLTEIAHELGYEDYAYFSRVFKEKTSISPSQFAKNYQ
ncbi:AraC-type DNA-binding protein [Zhouia amylolytica]|uniref:AraC-type DNA-binding protein n=1 Tax=Zhouia amylolytica TaxID=376730 RepID=A0A1I6UX86_9FLAO|nr:helix-turn-helix domain-containing protein [Zhouia amylolytica]SFT06050.1 AraC-type DNA-binding protein [Zhouia amylolytica]